MPLKCVLAIIFVAACSSPAVPASGLVLDEPYYASAREIMFRGRGTSAIRFDPSILPLDPEP